jgi:hypothetical protein
MKEVKMNKEELDWRAEDDARSIMQYAELKSDAKRWSRALKALEKLEKETSKKAETLRKLVNKKDVK